MGPGRVSAWPPGGLAAAPKSKFLSLYHFLSLTHSLGPIEPYGEFGIGAYIADLDVSGNLGDFSSSTKGVFGFHAGAGVNFNITPILFLGVEGRYLWAKPSFGGQDIKLDGFTVTADLGLRF
jgi:opacity protein-like surface antigen